jgi:hypothetical protein
VHRQIILTATLAPATSQYSSRIWKFEVITAVKIDIQNSMLYTGKGTKCLLLCGMISLSALSMSQQGRHMGLREGRQRNLKSDVISDCSETMNSYLHITQLLVWTGNN